MLSAKIQVNYEHLKQIVKVFAQHTRQTDALLAQVKRTLGELEAGHWRGKGAQSFYSEMCILVLPGVERLVNALQTGETTARHIYQVFEKAEEDASKGWDGIGATFTGKALSGAALSEFIESPDTDKEARTAFDTAVKLFLETYGHPGNFSEWARLLSKWSKPGDPMDEVAQAGRDQIRDLLVWLYLLLRSREDELITPEKYNDILKFALEDASAVFPELTHLDTLSGRELMLLLAKLQRRAELLALLYWAYVLNGERGNKYPIFDAEKMPLAELEAFLTSNASPFDDWVGGALSNLLWMLPGDEAWRTLNWQVEGLSPEQQISLLFALAQMITNGEDEEWGLFKVSPPPPGLEVPVAKLANDLYTRLQDIAKRAVTDEAFRNDLRNFKGIADFGSGSEIALAFAGIFQGLGPLLRKAKRSMGEFFKRVFGPKGLPDLDVGQAGNLVSASRPAPRLIVPEAEKGRGGEMLKQAREMLKQADPADRVAWFDDFAQQITAATGGTWNAKKTEPPNGGALYTGELQGFWFVITDQGEMYQGRDILEVTDFENGLDIRGNPISNPLFYQDKNGNFVPIYENLAKYWKVIQ